MKKLFLITELFGIIIMRTNAQNKIDSTRWSCHFQLTTVLQAHPPFPSLYSGKNSLYNGSESALSLTTTLFLGRKLWKGATFYFDPEISGGKGISGAVGIAGFPNGETFRIGDPAPALYVARAFIRQHISIGNDRLKETIDGDANQLPETLSSSRIDITIGKLAISDIFDNNSVSGDPRTEFLNWSLMSNGA